MARWASAALAGLVLTPWAPVRAAEPVSVPSSAWFGPPAPACPRRVVSLGPTLTEMVVAMGLSDRLVGVTRYDDLPAVAKLPRVGGWLDPSLEAVLTLHPDLVIWLDHTGGVGPAQGITTLGLPVMTLRIGDVADVIAAARLLGRALGDAPAGERLARQVSGTWEKARAERRPGPRPRVLFVVGHDPLVVAGPGSYPDDLLRAAGGENVVQDARPWSVYPLERAMVDDPTLVIDGGLHEPPSTLSRLSAIPAVRRGALRRLSDASALRPGPWLGRALSELSHILYPEKGTTAARNAAVDAPEGTP